MAFAVSAWNKSERNCLHVTNINQFAEVARNESGLVTLGVASSGVGRSRQRLHELIAKGKLNVYLFNGARYVSLREVLARFQHQQPKAPHDGPSGPAWA